MKKRSDWEQVTDGVARLFVPGGWLYFVRADSYSGGSACCFVPDASARPYQDTWRNASIDELQLSARPRHALINDNIQTIGQLMDKSDHELMRLPNFGRHSLREIYEAVEKFFQRENVYKEGRVPFTSAKTEPTE